MSTAVRINSLALSGTGPDDPGLDGGPRQAPGRHGRRPPGPGCSAAGPRDAGPGRRVRAAH